MRARGGRARGARQGATARAAAAARTCATSSSRVDAPAPGRQAQGRLLDDVDGAGGEGGAASRRCPAR